MLLLIPPQLPPAEASVMTYSLTGLQELAPDRHMNQEPSMTSVTAHASIKS